VRRQPHVSGQGAILLSATPHLAIAGWMIRADRRRCTHGSTSGSRSCRALEASWKPFDSLGVVARCWSSCGSDDGSRDNSVKPRGRLRTQKKQTRLRDL
jgi:hypothetical protein